MPRTLSRFLKTSLVTALGVSALSACDGNADSAPLYLLHMTQVSTDANGSEDTRMLLVIPDYTFEMLHPPAAPHIGTLTESQVKDLASALLPNAANAIAQAAAADQKACIAHPEGYSINIGDGLGGSSSGGTKCLIHSEVEGPARPYVDTLVALFEELGE